MVGGTLVNRLEKTYRGRDDRAIIPGQILQLRTTLKGQSTVDTVYRFDLQGWRVVRDSESAVLRVGIICLDLSLAVPSQVATCSPNQPFLHLVFPRLFSSQNEF